MAWNKMPVITKLPLSLQSHKPWDPGKWATIYFILFIILNNLTALYYSKKNFVICIYHYIFF